ncbi:ABC transporter substrate-binding protein [Bacteriovoracales bacterium]|nr:ABC transporter substrate-binding protein [Bacteriovoracales bacterium]
MKIKCILLASFIFTIGCKKEIKETKKNKIKEEIVQDVKGPSNIDDYLFMTEDFAPFNFLKDGKKVGSATDLLVEIFKKIGSKKTRKDIQVYPWARAYKYLQSKPETCLYSTTKTEKRAKLFKWFGPIIKIEFGILGKKNKNYIINNVKDLEKYVVGSVKNFAGEQLLVSAGFPLNKIRRLAKPIQFVKMIQKDKIDLIASNIINTKYILRSNGLNPDDFKTYYSFKEKPHYFACHISTPDSIIQKMQKALDEVKKEGTYNKIMNKYF